MGVVERATDKQKSAKQVQCSGIVVLIRVVWEEKVCQEMFRCTMLGFRTVLEDRGHDHDTDLIYDQTER